MKEIIEIKAKKTNACGGMYGLDAEAVVQDSATGEIVYICANWYDGEKHYVVSDHSLYELDEGDADSQSGQEWTETYKTADGFTTNNPYFIGAEGAEERLNALVEEAGGPDEANYPEEYERLSNAVQSEYYQIFVLLDKMLKALDE